MKRILTLLAVVGATFAVSACQPSYETEGDMLQRVGEETVQGIDTSGLGALQ